MLTITRTGSIAAVVASVRDVPQRIVPYAASTALTRAAKAAQASVIAAMPQAFDRPTPYTLRSTFVQPSTVQTQAARVAVKDYGEGKGTLPESYLLPSVVGGPRREKRMERNMRYAGALGRGMYVVLGRDAPAGLIDAYGNLKRGEVQRILTATRTAFDPAQNRTRSARSKRNARSAPYFVGGLPTGRFVGGEYQQRAGTMQPGVYRREGGRKIVPVLVFVRRTPSYPKRLDFEGLARAAALDHFEPAFRQALADMLAKGRP